MTTLFDQDSHPVKDFFSRVFKKLKKNQHFGKFLNYSKYIAGLFFILAIISLARVPFQLKKVYNYALLGKDNLEAAIYLAIEEEDFATSFDMAREAEENFNLASLNLSAAESNFLVSKVNFMKSQIDDSKKLLGAAKDLSSAVKEGANLGCDLENLLEGDKKLSFSKFTASEKKKMLKFISDSSHSFEKIKDGLKEASLRLGNLGYRGFLSSIKDEVENLKISVKAGEELISKALPMLKIMPVLLGYPERMNYLIALQNNDELRPTGGFLGTFSLMSMEYGEIIECKTHDIYHLDMPVNDLLQVEPPMPLKRYLGIDKWFMRDSNWSPDWPTSAKRIGWFYKHELSLNNQSDSIKATFTLNKNNTGSVLGDSFKNNSKEISGVIAITPATVTDLLAITGAVYIEGVEYNKDNFVDLLQYRVEKGYMQLGIPSWQRKEVISEIYKEIKIKLFDLPAEKWKEVIAVFDKNLREKNILLMTEEKNTQKLIREQGYAGEIKEVVGDFLMIVDANMASFKTDGVMEKRITYNVMKKNDKIISKVNLDYMNKGDFTWKTTRYRTYTRVYVPLGSKLIKAHGAIDNNVESYNESGKTCFAAFISIEPNKKGNLYFEYELPETIGDSSKYELYIQKQPGNNVRELAVSFDFDKGVKNHTSSLGAGSDEYIDNHLEWLTNLQEDRFFNVEF
ncbi:MAG: DUF4012 domain-containing protein [bacterium]